MKTPFLSEHFTIHSLAEGVYAAIATETGAGVSNAGVVNLGDRTLVFDAFENPQAAEDLLKACIHLTGRNPQTVIISHWHPDHWGGLQVFARCAILSTPAARQMMIPITKEMLQDKQEFSRIESDIQNAEARLAKEKNASKQHSLRLSINRTRHRLQALPTLEPTLPNQMFEGRIIFHGSRRTAELISTGKGHTESDCILHLAEDRVMFIGDIGFFQSQPFMPYGFPAEWIAQLDGMVTWNVDTYVPGHGPLGGKADLSLEADYIKALEDMVERVVQAGGTVKDALRKKLPAPFNAWQVTGQRFEANVRASFKRHSSD